MTARATPPAGSMRIESNGIELAVEVSTPASPRSNIPALLIMGLGMQLTAWPDELVDGLVAAGRTVIRFDNRDIGLSTKRAQWGRPNLLSASMLHAMGMRIRAPYSLADMAADTVGLLDALGVERAHVVGVSMGGMIGQILAARHPARIASFTCMMSTSGARHLPGPNWAARRALMSAPANPHDHDAVIEHLIEVLRVIGSPAYPTPEALLRERLARSVRRSVHPVGAARQLLAIAADGDRSTLISRIAVPTAIVHGRDDPLVRVEAAHDLARKIPGATLRVIDGMGHDLPPALAGDLLDAITGNFERSGA